MRFLFLALAFIFAIVWVCAFVMFHAAAFFVHVFLILAIVFLIVHLFRPGKA